MSDAPVHPAPPSGSHPPRRAPIGPVLAIVGGALLALIALAVTTGGGLALWAHGTQRDADGYFTTSSERLETTSYAITSDAIRLGSSGWDGPSDLGSLGRLRLTVTATGGSPVFVGIGRTADVAGYLAGVGHAEIDRIDVSPFSVSYRYRDGGPPARPPEAAGIWDASAAGRGAQTLEWAPRSGSWTVVVMRADGGSGVSVDASVGAKLPWLLPLGVSLVVGGLVGLLIGGVLLVVGVLVLANGRYVELAGPAPVPGHPVRLTGRLDEPMSRWLWLVKWVLLVPHLVILLALWIAFSVVTVAAFFAILVTGRYPESLFGFNVGVLRWTWRVTFYGYSALATDRYPPFTLGPAPDYPATLEIDRPDHLSRGLVLVKWWLLAIPQYLVVAVFAGGATAAGRGWAVAAGGGLIGLLVLFAAVALLFTARYPTGIFDLVMGMNRWVYRVIAYAALLRDDYPPFRLDQGGAEPEVPVGLGEPGSRPAPPAPPAPPAATSASPPSAPPETPASPETPETPETSG